MKKQKKENRAWKNKCERCSRKQEMEKEKRKRSRTNMEKEKRVEYKGKVNKA